MAQYLDPSDFDSPGGGYLNPSDFDEAPSPAPSPLAAAARQPQGFLGAAAERVGEIGGSLIDQSILSPGYRQKIKETVTTPYGMARLSPVGIAVEHVGLPALTNMIGKGGEAVDALGRGAFNEAGLHAVEAIPMVGPLIGGAVNKAVNESPAAAAGYLAPDVAMALTGPKVAPAARVGTRASRLVEWTPKDYEMGLGAFGVLNPAAWKALVGAYGVRRAVQFLKKLPEANRQMREPGRPVGPHRPSAADLAEHIEWLKGQPMPEPAVFPSQLEHVAGTAPKGHQWSPAGPLDKFSGIADHLRNLDTIETIPAHTPRGKFPVSGQKIYGEEGAPLPEAAPAAPADLAGWIQFIRSLPGKSKLPPEIIREQAINAMLEQEARGAAQAAGQGSGFESFQSSGKHPGFSSTGMWWLKRDLSGNPYTP